MTIPSKLASWCILIVAGLLLAATAKCGYALANVGLESKQATEILWSYFKQTGFMSLLLLPLAVALFDWWKVPQPETMHDGKKAPPGGG
jgi:hypothetical protein